MATPEQILISCKTCDTTHPQIPLKHGQQANCRLCGTELYRQVDNSLQRVIAFSSTSIILFLLSQYFSFLHFQIAERHSSITLFDTTFKLVKLGYWEIAIMVFTTSILIPFLVMLGMFYIAVNAEFKLQLPANNQILRLIKRLYPWSLIGVFMLGVLVAIVKLMDLATVIPGPSLFLLAGLLITMIAANASLDERLCWYWPEKNNFKNPESSTKNSLISCKSCHLVVGLEQEYQPCPRCNAQLQTRQPDSIGTTWALLLTAAIFYIPANLFPIMTVTKLASGEPDTIYSGVIKLIENELWGLALLVFFASIVVPSIKLLSMAFLLISTQKKSTWRPLERTRLFHFNEIIGAWSMLDIYLIAILVSLVRMDMLVSIDAGPGAGFFGAVVIFTLFAAHSFDPRLIWDSCYQIERDEINSNG